MKFIFINKDNSGFSEYNIRKAYFIPVAILLVVLLSLPSIFFYLKYEDLNLEFTEHKKIENSINKYIKFSENSIEKSSDEIQSIISQLDNLRERDDKIRGMIGLPIISHDKRKMGIGGIMDDSDDLNNLFPDENIENVDSFIFLVDSLIRVSSLQAMSYSNIFNYIEDNLDKILRTPAIHPVSMNECKMSSGYGLRVINNKTDMHDGHDFAPKENYWDTVIYATAKGIVKKSVYLPRTYGHYIEIDHGNGIVTAYAHLRVKYVSKGQKIERGQTIGIMGNTGHSSGTHLHYEIKKYGKSINPNEYYFDI